MIVYGKFSDCSLIRRIHDESIIRGLLVQNLCVNSKNKIHLHIKDMILFMMHRAKKGQIEP